MAGKQVANDPAEHLLVPTAGKDAQQIVFHSAEIGDGTGGVATSVDQNNPALAASNSQSPRATVSSAGQSAGSSVKQVSVTQFIAGQGLSLSNPA